MLGVDHLVLDGAGKGQVFPDLLVLEFRPEYAGGVQELKALCNREPLIGACNARAVLDVRLAALGKAVDQRALPHVRDAHHHHADLTAHHALCLPCGDAVLQDLFHQRDESVQSFVGFAVDGDRGDPLRLIIRDPAGGLRRVRHVALVHQNDARLRSNQLVEDRVPAADRNTRIDDLGHRVHQL